MLGEALRAQTAVERLDERILDWFARFDELQLHVVVGGPLIKHAAGKLGAVVSENYSRRVTAYSQPLQPSQTPSQ
jgi:hypothetical protein